MHKDINHLVRMDLNLLPILDTLLNEKASAKRRTNLMSLRQPSVSL